MEGFEGGCGFCCIIGLVIGEIVFEEFWVFVDVVLFMVFLFCVGGIGGILVVFMDWGDEIGLVGLRFGYNWFVGYFGVNWILVFGF